MPIFGVGFIGCGEIAEFHRQALTRLPQVRISAVCDRIPESAQALAKRAEAHIARGVEELLSRSDVDVVYILTRHDSHVQLVLEAASAGKAILCEKPMALTVEGAEAIVEAVALSDVPFMAGFNHRWNPAVQQARAWSKARRGAIRALHLTFATSPFLEGWPGLRQEGGGVFPCLGSHAIDLAQYLLDREIIRICALEARLRLSEPYLADTGGVLLQTVDGMIATLLFHDHAPPAYARYESGIDSHLLRAELFGEDWVVIIDDLSTIHHFEGEHHDSVSIRDMEPVERYGFVGEDRYFFDCLRAGLKPQPDARDGANIVRLLVQAALSINSGSLVSGRLDGS